MTINPERQGLAAEKFVLPSQEKYERKKKRRGKEREANKLTFKRRKNTVLKLKLF